MSRTKKDRHESEIKLAHDCLKQLAPAFVRLWLGKREAARARKLLASGERLHPRWVEVLGEPLHSIWGTPVTVEETGRIFRITKKGDRS